MGLVNNHCQIIITPGIIKYFSCRTNNIHDDHEDKDDEDEEDEDNGYENDDEDDEDYDDDLTRTKMMQRRLS